jgi:aspartate carbamoyltransferase catalytic subunit
MSSPSTASSSSFRKGETLKDTGQVLQAMNADFVVLRHSAPGAPQFLAERLKAHLVNAGDGAHEHPTQALLDAFTMRERLGDKRDWKDLHVVICGDILFSRVARSNVWALTKLGARVTLVGPTTLVPEIFSELGVTVAHDFDSVLPDADVIMLLRIQHERQRRSFFPSVGEYVSLFGLNRNASRSASRGCSSCIPARSIAAWRSPANWPTARTRPSSTRSETASPSAWPCCISSARRNKNLPSSGAKTAAESAR